MINTLRYKEDLIQFLIVKKEKEIILINDPIFKLISDLSDINKIENYQYYTKLLYINKNNIHEMLYNIQENINIKIYHTLTFYFYLSLLINDQKEIFNYKYSFDFINEISKIFLKTNNSNSNKIQKLIIAKLILDFVDNYKNFVEDENLEKITNEMENLINLNKNLKWGNINLSIIDINKNNIDEIYIQIIIILIENNNFENDDIINILNELSLETIYLTDIMFNKLSKFLNKNENIKKYEILQKDDLFKKEKITFYFILLKYILKHSYYIYNNNFL